jgi:hypothetical protein
MNSTTINIMSLTVREAAELAQSKGMTLSELFESEAVAK